MNSKTYLFLASLFLIFLSGQSGAQSPKKIRVIATTDGEIDDRCSMIRFLLYANEWDIRGIIHSSSKYHWKGNSTHPRHNWADESWLDRQLDAYAKVYPMLKANQPDYPSPEYLRQQVFTGNVDYVGDMQRETPGSNRIVQILLDPDPSPVWLQAWGGANTIARALKTIEEKHPDRKQEVSRKARLFLISLQDGTLDSYITKRWPKIQVILSTNFDAIAYGWQKHMSLSEQRFFSGPWMKQNVLNDHGPLCAMYEAHSDGRFRSEGDSPSFMHCIDVGLGAHRDPSWGGWGGRFVRTGPKWISASDQDDRFKPILRWAKAFQNDWAARADWCVRQPEQCNHPPVVVCSGDRSTRPLTLTVEPGARVKLDAGGTSDPDGHDLTYRWWTYVDAGTYWDSVEIRNAQAQQANLTVPSSASGRTVPIILEVTDNGSPALTRYRRVILEVKGNPKPSPRMQYLRTPIRKLGGPDPGSGPWTFYRGINVNGSPITIDGNRWEGDEAQNFESRDRPINASRVALRPPTDDARAKMIHAFRWNTQSRFAVTNVPQGTFAVFAYVWEDNQPETFSLSLNGKIVLPHHRSGVTGEWHRVGPWIVEVNNGRLELTTAGGAANISGIEIWKRNR